MHSDFDYDGSSAISFIRLLRPSFLRPIFRGVGLLITLVLALDLARLTSIALLDDVDDVPWLGTLEQPYVATSSEAQMHEFTSNKPFARHSGPTHLFPTRRGSWSNVAEERFLRFGRSGRSPCEELDGCGGRSGRSH